MRNYRQVQLLALDGTKEIAGYAGGRSRWLTWATSGDRVTASIYGQTIATFAPDGTVEIDTCGRPTMSTFDAIATALGVARAFVGTVARVPQIMGVPFTQVATLDTATGKVIEHDAASVVGPARRYP